MCLIKASGLSLAAILVRWGSWRWQMGTYRTKICNTPLACPWLRIVLPLRSHIRRCVFLQHDYFIIWQITTVQDLQHFAGVRVCTEYTVGRYLSQRVCGPYYHRVEDYCRRRWGLDGSGHDGRASGSRCTRGHYSGHRRRAGGVSDLHFLLLRRRRRIQSEPARNLGA